MIRAVGRRRSRLAHLSSGKDELGIRRRRRLRNDDLLKASGALQFSAAGAGVCRNVLPANRTRELELTHRVLAGPTSHRPAAATTLLWARKSFNARYLRFRRAALAPSFPRAVRTRLGKCLTVRLRLAAAAAFFMLRRAAARCLEELIISLAMSPLRQYRQ